jgi:L-lactate dehydrogenase complex protein LldE
MTSLPERPSPRGKRVSLFITCVMDMIYPETGMHVVELLEYLGVEVDFPEAQTCCGQPAFNAGYQQDTRAVALQFLRAFEDAEVIVTASGSCAAMVRHEYPHLFQDDPYWEPIAWRVASRTWEISEFIVDGLGISDLKLSLPEKRTFAFHDSCHGLRMMGLGEQGRTLIGSMGNAEVVALTESDVCCGFGGLFSVKMPEVSGAMLETKMKHINACDADDILLGDASCMIHINGGLERQKSPKRVQHLVDILAQGLHNREAHDLEEKSHHGE